MLLVLAQGFESFNFKGNAERDEEAYNLALKSAMENQNKSAAIGR